MKFFVYKSTDNKNNDRCNTQAYLMETKAQFHWHFSMLYKNQIDGSHP